MSRIKAKQVRRRLFLALQPQQSQRQRLLRRVAEHCPDLMPTEATVSELKKLGIRPVPVANLHITLVFLGSVTAEVQSCVERVAAAVMAPAFSITLDRLGYWPRQQMLWAMPNLNHASPSVSPLVPKALIFLVESLRQGLAGCDVTLEQRDYWPHVTLARQWARGLQDEQIEPVEWYLDCFVLMESVSTPGGVQYSVLQSWPLLGS